MKERIEHTEHRTTVDPLRNTGAAYSRFGERAPAPEAPTTASPDDEADGSPWKP